MFGRPGQRDSGATIDGSQLHAVGMDRNPETLNLLARSLELIHGFIDAERGPFAVRPGEFRFPSPAGFGMLAPMTTAFHAESRSCFSYLSGVTE